jgi:hypothetical protein
MTDEKREVYSKWLNIIPLAILLFSPLMTTAIVLYALVYLFKGKD